MRILRRRFNAALNQLPERLFSILPAAAKSQMSFLLPAKRSLGPAGKYASLPDEQCAICFENAALDLSSTDLSEPREHTIQTPYRASCGHIFCYHCLATALMHAVSEGEKGWDCSRCGELVLNATRVTAVSLLDDDSPSIDSLDVDNISLDSYDSLRPATTSSSQISISSG